MIIEADIRKKLHDFELDISFSTDCNRIGVLGASGGGKSMCLKSLAGIAAPDSGRIALDGNVLFDKNSRINVSPAERSIGYLFQSYALFPNMTVEGNINAAIHAAERLKRREGKNADISADKLMDMLNISDIRKRYPREISGGQQQRTALARILASDPKLLLLDEPFTALDTFLRERTRLELAELLNELGKSFILVSHDRDEIYQMCEYLILLEKGKVIAAGKTDDVFMNPGTVAAAKLTGCKNISRIEKLSDHRVRALDWGGLELVTEMKVTDDAGFIGIRAHDFEPAVGEGSAAAAGVEVTTGNARDDVPGGTSNKKTFNIIRCGKTSVTRLPFEWYIMLENGLWWKKERSLYDESEETLVPNELYIDPGKIIILRKK